MATERKKIIFTIPLLFSPMVAGAIVEWLSVHYFYLKEGIPVALYLISLAFGLLGVGRQPLCHSESG
jgi:hypothetical protein